MQVHMQALAIVCASIRDSTGKMQKVRSLFSLSGSFTASLHSTNSPVFIKKSSKHTNCLLSRSCLLFADVAIIGPCLLACTRTSARQCTSTCQGCILHTRAISTPLRVATSLLACIYQVTCERYCMFRAKIDTLVHGNRTVVHVQFCM